MESLLFGVDALDVTTYVTVSAILVITAALAAYLPARRVTRIDPMQALRAEYGAETSIVSLISPSSCEENARAGARSL